MTTTTTFDTNFECHECEAALNMLFEARAERAAAESLARDASVFYAEAKRLALQTLEMNQRAILESAQTDKPN